MRWINERFAFGSSDCIMQTASTSFDASVWEILAPLMTGARMSIVRDSADLDALVHVLKTSEVTALLWVPSLLRAMIDHPEFTEASRKLRLLFCGGEAFESSLRDSVVRITDAVPVNLYGPTECAIYATSSECRTGPVTLGRPVANTRVYVVDEYLQLVSSGAVGELCIGGAQVARGYLGMPALTAEKFVPDPFGDEPGARLYRTGDRVRWSPEGELEFLGRPDAQVKVRGFRVELGEVESALLADPVVREAVVVARSDAHGSNSLAAYVTMRDLASDTASSETMASSAALRTRLSAKLPNYMVPGDIQILDKLPLSPSGKLDRHALPAAHVSSHLRRYEAPRDALEAQLCAIFAEVLQVPRVGIRDNFFALGGHSLLAARAVSRILNVLKRAVPLRTLFEAGTVAELAMRAVSTAELDPIGHADREAPLVLSFSQERLWLLDQMMPGSGSYNVAVALRLRGALDEPALARAFDELVRRHEALRTTFVWEQGAARQHIQPASEGTLQIDASAISDAELVRRVQAEASRPFELSRGPLLRATLLRCSDSERVLCVTAHHIVCDGWSAGVVVREVLELYQAFSCGLRSPLAELDLQYADFAAWQRTAMSSERLASGLSHWRQALEGAPPALHLPCDRTRPSRQSYRGAALSFTVPADVTTELRALGRAQNATLFMTLLASFGAFLWRHTAQADFLIGTPVANRARTELEGLIGFFVNTLPLRVRISEGQTFEQLLEAVKATSLSAFEYQEIPFEKIVEAVNPPRDMSRSPLFQVMFALQNAPSTEFEIEGLDVETVPIEVDSAKFDLLLDVNERESTLEMVFQYNIDLFERKTIERMRDRLLGLFAAIVRSPRARMDELTLLSVEEQRSLLVDHNATHRDFGGTRLVHELFEAQVARTPTAVAVDCEHERWSYRDLNERADQLAHELLSSNPRPERFIGVYLDRGPEIVQAMLGILKSGAVYVPLDPGYPPDRVAQMIASIGLDCVVTSRRRSAELPEHITRVTIDSPLLAQQSGRPARPPYGSCTAGSLAYVIFTSGSTGAPKATGISHAAIANHMLWMNERFGFGPQDCIVQRTSTSFDASVWELLAPLTTGARMTMVRATADVRLLVQAMLSAKATVLQCVPSLLRVLVADPGFADAARALRLVFCGGEPFESSLRDALVRVTNATPVNLYGPTECTIDATFLECKLGPVTLGRPVANVRAYVLDERLQLVPSGIPGELCIGGAQLARGYLGMPALTAERFVPDPFGEPGARLYRTGDRVRWAPTGDLEFLGRFDDQVKIRGFRIEFGEIEAKLAEHPGVAMVAAAVNPGADRLIAYVVPKDPSARLQPGQLRDFLARLVPAHMVPSVFVLLDSLPRMASGKIDRRALPQPQAVGETIRVDDELEAAILGLWTNLVPGLLLQRDVTFFDAGGSSLDIVRLQAALAQELSISVPVTAFFEHPTLEALARYVRTSGSVPPTYSRQTRDDRIEKLHALGSRRRNSP
jgi:amino acid adenylation domain-containing protein